MKSTELLDQLDQAHTAWRQGSAGWPDQAIEAMETLPQLTAALRAVLELTYASDDGTEWEHNGHEWPADGEPECPGCWADSIRTAVESALTAEPRP